MNRERKKGVYVVPGTVVGRALRNKLTKTTFSGYNGVRLKKNIFSKRFPCIRKKGKRTFKRREKEL
jgi:hypothetical protein